MSHFRGRRSRRRRELLMLQELTIKNHATRHALAFPSCSPAEIAADVLAGLEKHGEGLPPGAVELAEHYAALALSSADRRAKAGIADPAWLRRGEADFRPQSLSTVDPATWAGKPIPVREWLLDEWIPANTTTLFTGAGGVGKSLMGQQLATAVSLGVPFMGLAVASGSALYLTCEDDMDELHRRQSAICAAMNVDLAELTRLHLVSLTNGGDNMLAAFAADNTMAVQPLMAKLRTTVDAIAPSLIVLDNVAHLFGGNEIVKAHVAAFIGLLNGLAKRAGAAVLLVAHPNKAGDSYSGNVAWENQVRSRIFLDRPKEASGRVIDPDARVLSRDKSNYAKVGATVEFRWHRWAFVQNGDLASGELAQVTAALVAGAEDRAFLSCLDAATRQKRTASHTPGTNYAPKTFALMPEGKGHNKAAFERAMLRLASAGEIEFDADLWPGPNRHMRRGIRRVQGREAPNSSNSVY